MPQHSRSYNWISCSSRQNNLMQPTCPMTSDADFAEMEVILQRALAAGWSQTANGKDFLCPLHSKESVDKPARAPRKNAAASVPMQEQ